MWFALRVTYGRAMAAKHEFDSLKLRSFLPLTTRIVMRGERRIKTIVPAISNLIFLDIDPEEMQELKTRLKQPVRYIMNHETRKPITVPERQMKAFIAVASHTDDDLLYLDEHTAASLRPGTRVRVTGGVFQGAEGRFLRLKGDRRVVVEIPGVAAVATTFIHPSLIEPLTDD